MFKFIKFVKELVVPTVDQLAVMIRDDRYPDTNKLTDDINTLISWAENLGHLRVALSNGHPGSGHHISGKINYRQLWDKWLELTTSIAELREMKAYWKWLSCDEKIRLVRKWFVLATTLDEMIDIPESHDEILNELVANKRRKLVVEAFQSASTCQDIVSVCLEIKSEDEPKVSLGQYGAWQNDGDLNLANLKRLCEKYGTRFAEDASAKWLAVSKRMIAEAQNLTEFMRIKRSQTHPESNIEYIERWDVLAASAITNASTIEDARGVAENCREDSEVKKLAHEKWDTLLCDLLQLQSEIGVDALKVMSENDHCPRSAERAAEKLVDLATTEEDIRGVWWFTVKFPAVKARLANKLDPLIR